MQPFEPGPDDTTASPPGLARFALPGTSRFLPGTRIGPYRLVEQLGSGGFGDVWLAERESAVAASRLAVKLPHTAVDLDATRKEAEVWVRAASHPNVLTFFEANAYDGQVIIASEYAPDGSLKDWLDRHGKKAPSVEAAADMAMGILNGLEHLHVRGIIHRDLKPANILMQGECPRIADFGLARLIDTSASSTGVAGSPAYMAPEAFDGRRSVQTDVWAVGVILHLLLSGELPFPSGEMMQLVKAIATAPPLPLPSSVPGPLQQVARTAVAKDPGARFRSAADMRAALRDALRQSEAAMSPVPLPSQRGGCTVAVTGSMRADPHRVSHRVPALLFPYFTPHTTWGGGLLALYDGVSEPFVE